MPDYIDLRSDTVTKPTSAMRRAMAEAEVGDDVFGDDPTVIALEERAAELTGKAAGLFVPSGTMGNLVSHMAHVPRGGEIVAEAESHVVQDEAGGHAVVSGATVRTVPAGPDGRMDLDDIAAAMRDPYDFHQPPTALVILENTHAQSMGQPLNAEYTAQVAEIAREHGVPLHVDGARLWNAVIALGTPAPDLLAAADSATFCLSKALSCPVGSVVVGPKDFIGRARRARKLVGGGMRQVGVLAAPGLVALSDGPDGMIERLIEDHTNARLLADGLAEMGGIVDLDPARVRTNYVVFGVRPRPGQERLDARGAFLAEMQGRGVAYIQYSHGRIRALTHYGIERADIERTLAATRESLAAAGLTATTA
ncbi:MAG: GntG family PLP-dependent aldolase [Chloroflexota bacterium]|nr:GntG family PLP-dependent aldolase [Chloroflexota bacterium]